MSCKKFLILGWIIKWAEVDEHDFKKKIRKFKNNSNIPKEWAQDLGRKIREKYSWLEVSKMYDEALGELLS